MELKGSQTEKNLWAAFAGESQARTKYTFFASKAKKDGFVRLFDAVGKIEKEHEERYKLLLVNVEQDKVFKKGEKIIWQCLNCGYVCEGPQAPPKCPVCDHPQAYFQQVARNY